MASLLALRARPCAGFGRTAMAYTRIPPSTWIV